MKTTQSYGRIAIGLVLLVLGLVFLLQELGLINFSLGGFISTWWPLAIVAAGIIALINNPHSFIFPLFIILVGILLQFQRFDYISGNVWGIIWPTALLVFGLSLLFERSTRGQLLGNKKDENEDADDDLPTSTNTDDSLSVLSIFSGSDVRNVSDNFKGGDANALFGGFEIDLRDAKIKKSATINVFAAFGGGDIVVPEGWNVKTSGLPLFGGWEDKTRTPSNKKAPILYVRGTCIFGGISITHKKS